MTFTRNLFVVAALLTCAASSARAGAEKTTPEFLADALTKINEYRAHHGAPPLTMSPALNQYAEERVAAVSEKDGLTAGHAGLKPGYGENLYWGWSSSTSTYGATMAVDSWYGEKQEYKGVQSAATDQFTQLIWKNTTEVGCARTTKQGSSYFSTWIVCVFTPPGNKSGLFAANVLPFIPVLPPVKKQARRSGKSAL